MGDGERDGASVRVLILATGSDTGGQGDRIAEGFRRHAPDWDVESIATSRHVFGYPERVTGSMVSRRQIAAEKYPSADVIHLRTTLQGHDLYDRGRHKPTILHHHGTMFRTQHGRIAQQARAMGAVQIASTLDLTLLEPDVTWIPSPYDLGFLRRIRRQNYHPPDDQLVVAHYPTSIRIKSSMAFIRALDGTGAHLVTNVRGKAVRQMPWNDPEKPSVLPNKARADVYLDQLTLGIGNNAIEAMAMGIPVVAGVVDPYVRRLMLRTWGELPWVDANEQNVAAVIGRLLRSKAMREEYAERGTRYVERWHADSVVVEMLKGVYSSAQPTRHVSIVAQPRRVRGVTYEMAGVL